MWFAAAVGFGVTLAVFWPGYMSFDTAVQWWQARHGEYTNIHPPLMAMGWSLSEKLWPGPGPLFALFALLHWSALALLIQPLAAPAWGRVLLIWIAGFWPPLFALLAHVWKDVAVMTLFGIAVALLALDLRRPQRHWRWLALLALLLGCSMRHNAATALLPLLIWMAWETRVVIARRPFVSSMGLGLAGSVLMVMLAQLPDRLPSVERFPAWPAIAAWDIAAVSIAQQRLLLPPSLMAPGGTLPRLAQHYTPATNVPTFTQGGVKTHFLVPYTDAEYRNLRATWLSLPWRYSMPYVEHRAAVAERLFRWRSDRLSDDLVLMPGVVAYRDNPRLSPRTDRLNASIQHALRKLVHTPLFSGWIYLLLALAATIVGMRRSDARGRLAAATAASGLCYALPLLIAAGSAEFRYLSWLLVATVSSLLLLVPARPPQLRAIRDHVGSSSSTLLIGSSA